MVPFSDHVSDTTTILAGKDSKGPSKASTFFKRRHFTPYIEYIILKNLSKGIYSQAEVYIVSLWGSK